MERVIMTKTPKALRLAKALINGAESRNLQEVELALEYGASVNALESEVSIMPAWPAGGALHWAAVNADEPMIRHLIDKGADLELRTALGRTPLLVAAEALSVAGCRALLDAGADVNAVGPIGETALHIVAWEMSGDTGVGPGALRSRGYSEAEAIASLLIERGARVDLATSAGFTALQTCRPSVGILLQRMRDASSSPAVALRSAAAGAGPA
jgi:hypothetical protein